jgi:hypothetical protein
MQSAPDAFMKQLGNLTPAMVMLRFIPILSPPHERTHGYVG